jgi:hypothetical protein
MWGGARLGKALLGEVEVTQRPACHTMAQPQASLALVIPYDGCGCAAEHFVTGE